MKVINKVRYGGVCATCGETLDPRYDWTGYEHDCPKPVYVVMNNNPKRKKTSDCVIRSIAYALDKSWYEVFDELVIIAR